jgi:sec-independent protein translocase protein TatB
MFLDVGWSEVFLIAIITILVLGPQEIPKVMLFLGRITRRLQYVRYAFSQQFEDMMKDAGMEDLRTRVNFEEKPVFDEAAADDDETGPDGEGQPSVIIADSSERGTP